MNKVLIMLAMLITPIIVYGKVDDTWVENEKNLTPTVKKELHDYLGGLKQINENCKKHRKELKDKISPEAKKVLEDRKEKFKQMKKSNVKNNKPTN